MYCVAMYKNRVVLFFVINYTHSFIHPSSRLRWIWRLSQEYFVMRQEYILGGIFHHRATHTHLFIYIVNKRLYIFVDFSSSFFKSSRAFKRTSSQTSLLTGSGLWASVRTPLNPVRSALEHREVASSHPPHIQSTRTTVLSVMRLRSRRCRYCDSVSSPTACRSTTSRFDN